MIDKTKKEKIGAVFFVLVLFFLVGGLLTSIGYTNKKRTENLSRVVKQNQVKMFVSSNLSWLTATRPIPWAKRDSHTAFVFKDKMWILGGLDASLSMENGEPNYDRAIYYNDIWSSTDGFSWNKEIANAAFPPIRSASIFQIEEKLFMVGGYSPNQNIGYKNGLWTSLDGINWKKENITLPWPEREGQKVIKFKDRYLMIGGVNYLTKQRFNDVWASADGYNWLLLNRNAEWEPRWDMEISEFNEKLWLTGGMTSVNRIFGDEWVSSDGKNWQLVYQDAPFGKRQGHASIVTNGNLLLIGGIKETEDPTGEVWKTIDGVNWESLPTNWTAREDHSVVLFNNIVWILGGMNYKYDWLAEVLHSSFADFDGEKNNLKTLNSNPENLFPNNCATSTDEISSGRLATLFVNRANGLAAGFVPSSLISLKGVVRTDGDVCLNKLAGENLIQMFRQAKKENINLSVTYGYRSPFEQQKLFDYWSKQGGEEEAKRGVALPYYSEHQLGVAVDLTGESINYLGISMKFAETKESKWLENNAYHFGFVLSYPTGKEDITGYIYEPWHYRYVGNSVAKTLHTKNETFTEYVKDININ